MKLRFLLPSVIFMFSALASHAQINEALRQGFENGEPSNYSGNGELTTTLYSGGQQSLALNQSATSDQTLILDTLDFSGDATLRFLSLEFDHICNVLHNSGSSLRMGMIYYKFAHQSDNDWTALSNQHYSGTSFEFTQVGGFNKFTYADWAAGTPTNEYWRSERFDLNGVLTSNVQPSQRKIILKFVLARKTNNQNPLGTWYIDNIKINASSSAMVTPSLTASCYPDGFNYPNSRGAHIEVDASTTTADGINPDSVYLIYRVSNNPTRHRVAMSPVTGTPGRYAANIPFFGYDTLMHFYCVARDASSNANMVTFPKATDSWVTYRCVRGVEQPGLATPQFTGSGSISTFPFPNYYAHKSEFIFDSALMADAGYGPGTITGFKFTYASSVDAGTRNRVQIKMRNAPTNYTIDTSTFESRTFTNSYMHVVYDGQLQTNAGNTGYMQNITLQDSFYYAGKDIVMQVTAQSDPVAQIWMRMIPVVTGKGTIFQNLSYGNPFDATNIEFQSAENSSNRRPAFVFNQSANLPLLYDLGISELIDPSYSTAMVSRPGSITVRLKNFGALTANAIRIRYSIDDTIFGFYDWNGTLAGDQTTDVTIATNINIPAGYHTLRAWVDDTLTAAGNLYRDHEPLNDTSFSQFIVCDGPLAGVRNIGGPNADYNDIEEFLFSLSRCGINDSLIVKLAPGAYPPFIMPATQGLSASNYIVFEPAGGSVTLYSSDLYPNASISDLTRVSNIRFRNINFVRRSGALTDMVTLGLNSSNCRFENCTFTDSLMESSASMRISAMINTGFAHNTTIDRCTFIGGRVGVDIKGQASDIPSANNTVCHSLFRGQDETAISVQNQSNIVIDSNEMYDVLTNTNYVLMIYECSGASRFTNNKIYTSHSAGGIGLSNSNGTSSTHILVANNMIVCEDLGQSNLIRSPLNIISGVWTDVVYNTVKMSAPIRNNTAAATFGSGGIENCRFLNNIVVCLDNVNYALNYNPMGSTTNTVGHNVYYSRGQFMNRMAGITCPDITTWRAALPSDTASISTNPNFLNGSQVDLRTYNRLVKGVGTPIAGITTDMFGTPRHATAPCAGAFEFVSLAYDFEPEGLVSPETVTCDMPTSVELAILMRNSGVNPYNSTVGGLTLHYQVNGGATNQVAINQNIPAEDTITIHTGAMLQLPPNGILDSTHTIRVWLTFTGNDPNQTNDSNTFTVVSKYHPAVPSNYTDSVDYANPITLDPMLGVDTWAVYNSTAAPRSKSQIYWYNDSTSTTPFHVGRTFTTDTIRQDTAFYIRQRRELPIVRFTQVEIAHATTTAGVSPNLPNWMLATRKIAIQLTNIGDATAHLEGDTLMTLAPSTTNNNNKVFTFGDVSIEPGQSLIVQLGSGNSTNLPMTVSTNSINFTINNANAANVAFVYKHNGIVEDVVALNTAPTATYPANQTVTWTSTNIPSYVWQGAGVTMAYNAGAGLVRTGFDGNATDWRIATNENPMFLNTIDPNWIRYEDNGCDGGMARVDVVLRNAPMADLAVDAPVLPQPECDMGDEDITVTVHNYGVLPVSSLVLNYWAGGDTVSEAISTGIPANGAITHTFAQQLNMAFNSDSTVTVKVWVDSIGNDHTHLNDTNIASTFAPFTPSAPTTLGTRVVQYADRDTITAPSSSSLLTPVWYDYNMNPVDTGHTHITDILYTGGTMGMAYIATSYRQGQIGFGTTLNNNTAYPAPYQTNNKFAKQQYIYSASELLAAGLRPGKIECISFYLDTINNTTNTQPTDSIVFNKYYLALGATSDTIFSSTTAWKPTSVVIERDMMKVYRASSKGWITHTLDSSFYWDGVSSLVVQVSAQVDPVFTKGVRSHCTAKSNTTLIKADNNSLNPSVLGYTGAGTRGNNRPNIRINNTIYGNAVYDGCVGPVTPYTVQLANLPAADLAVLWPAGVDTLQYNSCGNSPIDLNLRNQGSSDLDNVKVYYVLDTLPVDSITVSGSVMSGQTRNIQLMNRLFSPGRHTLKTFVSVPGDLTQSNDTIVRTFVVRFCGGNYTIAQTGTPDFRTFSEAVDTLNIAGIEGPVTFQVSNGIYNEQLYLGDLPGSSSINTVSFIGVGDSVLLTASTSQANNYVISLDNTSNFTLQNLLIEARPTVNNVNYANALVMQDGSNISITDCRIKVKGSINNANASCVVLNGNISGLTMTGNTIDSGYYSIKSTGTVQGYSDITIRNNTLQNFWSQGINLRGVINIDITSNEINSGVTIAGRGLTGIYLGQTAGSLSILKNKIYLIDDKNGGKRGIQLTHASCTNINPGLIANNMISCSGTGTAGLTPAKPSGIWIDSSSTYINILFNSVRVYCGPYANSQFSDASYAFFSGATSRNLQVMSNIFSNFSKGYAYYISDANNVISSNFNAYYTVSTRPFAWQTPQIDNLAALQTANSDDGNSLFSEPYFTSERDLHLQMTSLVARAQYNTSVPDDIDGNIRPEIPAPTIGAHEKGMTTHDMAVVRIYEPIMPANINVPTHIESDSVLVKASFYNNGRSPENNVRWFAYIEGHETTTMSDTVVIGSFQPAEMKTDSLWMPTTLGITREQTVRVVVLCDEDSFLNDNMLTTPIYLAPAYNLAATKMATNRTGCKLTDAIVKITLKNEGFKAIPAGDVIKIGYHTEVATPANVTISTLPDTVEDFITLTEAILPNRTTIIDFPTIANLYPTDTSLNIKVKITGWCNHPFDITPENDTTKLNNQIATVDAFYTPAPPIGYDTFFPYGTWGEVRASQINSRPIRWYRDSTVSHFYTNNNYNTSTMWRNTPQYFSDSTYYLNCFSDKNCPSNFSAVNVRVNPRVANDVAMEAILAPLGNRVYMENDTLRVRIVNYGTSPQSNIPIAFQLKQGNNILQEVTEICPAIVTPQQTHVYTFNTLLNVNSPTQAKNFTLNVWTNLTSDVVRRNDTIRNAYTFRSLAESLYAPQKSANPSFDITRVSFNEIDLELPPMGRGLTNLASYAAPDYPVLHVKRGTTDSLLVEVTQLDPEALPIRHKVWAMIDFDRSGTFSNDEIVVNGNLFYSNETATAAITIPNTVTYGYMRMRVAVGLNADYAGTTTIPTSGIPSDKDGHTMEFLLFVDEQPVASDLAITQIVSPRSYLIRDNAPRVVSFRISNKGSNPIANPEFSFAFEGDTIDPDATGTVTYTGVLQSGSSAIVTLPSHQFPLGTSKLTIWHSLANDANNGNDTLVQEYHRFHEIILTMEDNFDDLNMWYAPMGKSNYSRNYWELGTPAGTRFNAAHSAPNAWVTDLDASITSGQRGNVSYLYSPIINTTIIRSDTLSFYLRRNLTNGSSVHLEFRNFENKWVKAIDTSSRNTWYNDSEKEVFNQTSSGNNWEHYWIPTKQISADFPEMLQFRFVYTTPIVSNANTNFGEGCALDDFRINKGPLRLDAGVVAILQPTNPQYGQTIYPEVVVKNFGTDTLRSIGLGYIYYGTSMASESSFQCHIAPGETDTFLFNEPFVITHEFPQEFSIQAFPNLASDYYTENDTCTRTYTLIPLNHDISAEEFVYPLSRVIAGDSVTVTMRIRNFGAAPIESATASYLVNGQNRIDEEIDFTQLLGRPLASMEFYNFTFEQKIWAPMGIIKLTGIIKSEHNDYVYNDTIYKRIEGISNITDLTATAVIVDTSDWNHVRIQLVIDNTGSRGVNNFEVGFYLDNNPAVTYREVYSTSNPLPALSTGHHLFSTTLPYRASGYRNVTAFVHIDGDNDPSNDTTTTLLRQTTDLKAIKVVVEENSNPEANVYLQVTNVGNMALVESPVQLRATINGTTLTATCNRILLPGIVYNLKLDGTIEKSTTQTYIGEGRLTCGNDGDPNNNETNQVEVRSHVLDAPTVDGLQLVLEQNFPNPFSLQTAVPFTLPNAATVRFFVMDAMGHILHSFERRYEQGHHTVTLDLSDYPSGIYFYGIQVDGERRMRKMIMR